MTTNFNVNLFFIIYLFINGMFWNNSEPNYFLRIVMFQRQHKTVCSFRFQTKYYKTINRKQNWYCLSKSSLNYLLLFKHKSFRMHIFSLYIFTTWDCVKLFCTSSPGIMSNHINRNLAETVRFDLQLSVSAPTKPCKNKVFSVVRVKT